MKKDKTKKYFSTPYAVAAWIFLIIFLGINMIFTPLKVSGHSMDSTLFNGQNLIGLNYKLKLPIIKANTNIKLFTPKKDDIVVVDAPQSTMEKFGVNSDELLIKRVIGTPGDTVSVSNNMVYLNDKPLHEYYMKDDKIFDNTTEQQVTDVSPKYFINEKMTSNGTLQNTPVQYHLGKNQIWVQGDNRNHSSDSRVFGAFDENTELKEKVLTNINLPIKYSTIQWILLALIFINTGLWIFYDSKNKKD